MLVLVHDLFFIKNNLSNVPSISLMNIFSVSVKGQYFVITFSFSFQ